MNFQQEMDRAQNEDECFKNSSSFFQEERETCGEFGRVIGIESNSFKIGEVELIGTR